MSTVNPYAASDGQCALVEAIDNANNDAQTHADCPAGNGADVITLGTVLTLDGSVLFPVSSPIFFDPGESGLPEISSDITIRDGKLVRISQQNFRFFVVQSSGILRLDHVDLTEGKVIGHCGFASGQDFSGCGGAIVVNNGSLHLHHSLFRNNSAIESAPEDNTRGGAIVMLGGTLEILDTRFYHNQAERGGAIAVQITTANMIHSVFSGNTSTTHGGAVYSAFPGNITIADSRFSNNQVTMAINASDGGGAISNVGSNSQLTVINTAFINNSAGNGGAINNLNASDAFISNSTFQGNTAATGGAIFNEGSGATINLFSNTISQNSAQRGGGIANGYLGSGIASIVDTLVYDNTAVNDGGGVLSQGDLTIKNSVLDNNTGLNGGGLAVASGGFQQVNVDASIFSNNFASTKGGGIFFRQNPTEFPNTLTVTDSTFDTNEADEGGGVYAEVTDVSINGSTFSNNFASGLGGGLHIRSFVTTGSIVDVLNSTFSSNIASQDGGGIYFSGSTITANIFNSTIASNTANSANGGDGIHNLALPADVAIQDSILAFNGNRNCRESDPDTVTDNGNNISSDSTCGFADTGGGVGDGVDALLQSLASNGGSTLTHAISDISPAADQGSGECTENDQRGAGRAGNCDMGAFESSSPYATVSISSEQTTLFEEEMTVATISVIVDNTSVDALPVDLLIHLKVNGSATAVGYDYVLSNQNGLGDAFPGQVNPLIFNIGAGAMTSQNITLTVQDDELFEIDETILIEATVVGNASFSPTDILQFSIVSDEPRPGGNSIFKDGLESFEL